MSKVLAFLARDIRIQRSYRVMFLIDVVVLFLGIIRYYFLARFVGPAVSGDIQQYGGDYFSFILIGVVLQDYLTTPLAVFSKYIRESQLNGTLEALLSTETPLHAVILLSAIYPLLWSTVNVALYMVFGVAVFGMKVDDVNWPAAALILMFALAVSSGLGIISASFILVFKRGEPLTLLISLTSWVFAGVLYPVSVLPASLQAISAVLPIRYAIDGMRGAILQKATWIELWPSLAPLSLFAILILPIGLLSFQYAHRWVRTVGSLSEY